MTNSVKINDHIKVKNTEATAIFSKQGGQILSWQPTNQEDILWLSRDAVFAEGKSIRGGVPICWPWFGMHTTNDDLPQHGFVRKTAWNLKDIESSEGLSIIEFEYSHSKNDQWPHDAIVNLKYTVGKELKIELTTHNTSENYFTITQALHTYFHIGDIEKISIQGLEQHEYIDTLKQDEVYQQEGAIKINSEIDRIYKNVASQVTLHDPVLNRNISISGNGANSVIVWNPWIEKSKRLGDMGEPDSFRKMLCIETANAREDSVNIKPGQSFLLSTEIKFENL